MPFLISEEAIPGVLLRRTTFLPCSSHHNKHFTYTILSLLKD